MATESPVLPRKRPQPDSPSITKPLKLLEPEEKLYDLIVATKNMGMLQPELRKRSDMQDYVFKKAVGALKLKNYIKEVPCANNKKKKLLMAEHFVPSDEVTGGALYTDGVLDTKFTNDLENLCLQRLKPPDIATIDQLHHYCNSRLDKGCSTKQVSMIVQLLVDINEVEELKSSGVGEFTRVPRGKICYRRARGSKQSDEYVEASASASVPCLACPRIFNCTPDGVISPITCEYYNKWLSF